jgi:hypothetical protein
MDCAHRFDGYAYLKEIKSREYSGPQYLSEMQKYIERTGKLFASPIQNMATNFFLHRCFHHWGWLPSAYSPEWYQMAFFYLHLYRLPTPAKYRHDNSASQWDKREKGAAEAAAAEIRQMLMRR